jgi:predicted RNA-binding protein YlxR (DUF448 family)
MAEPSPGPEPEDEAAEERGPLRRCIVTRESLPKERMIRFVLGPGGILVPDLAGRLPGRGMWLSARADVLERATSRGAFARAARGALTVPADLGAQLRAGLERRIAERIGLARRAGQAVCGFQQVRDWLQQGKAGCLVEASDGSPAERERLRGGRPVPVVAPLTSAQLGAVFGRDHAVQVALSPGRLAEGVLSDAARLAGLRGEA